MTHMRFVYLKGLGRGGRKNRFRLAETNASTDRKTDRDKNVIGSRGRARVTESYVICTFIYNFRFNHYLYCPFLLSLLQ